MPSHIWRVVARVAPAQHGLVTRGQLLDAHVSERSIDHHLAVGSLDRLHASVYRAPGAPRTRPQMVLAAILAAGPKAAAASRTALANWELLDEDDRPIELLVPMSANPRPDGFVIHRTRRPFEICVVHGLPTTSVVRALEDVSRVVPARTLEQLIDSALYRRLVSVDELRTARGSVGRLAGGREAASVESVLEARFLRLLREGGLPLPVPQYEVRRGGILIARVDFAYPAERIVIELESFQYHSGRQAFDRGNRRFKELQAAGYLILPFTSTDLRRPKQVDRTVRRSLWERGHPDVVQL